MAGNINLSKIRYLSFEGGGGKGLAYVAVVKALEKKILPDLNSTSSPPLPYETTITGHRAIFNLSKPISERHFLGVSGASAGAITAFMLALGMSSKDVEDEMNREVKMFVGAKNEDVSVFEKFFEGPDKSNLLRAINSRDLGDKVEREIKYPNYAALFKGIGAANQIVTGFEDVITQLGNEFVNSILYKKVWATEPVKYNRWMFIHSLLMNGGLFTGMEIRVFLEGLIKKYLLESNRPSVEKYRARNPNTITFQEFFDMTGVDFVVTGSNISQKLSLHFSVGSTPDFFVTEAVGISMCLPPAFKPIFVDYWVDSNLKRNDPHNLKYIGLFVDGGLLNNLPRNAFDNLCYFEKFTFNGKPLQGLLACNVEASHSRNNHTLAFNLKEAPENPFDYTKAKLFEKRNSAFLFKPVLSDIIDSLMSSTNLQFVTKEDEENKIDVKVYLEGGKGKRYSLDTLDFSTPHQNEKRGQNEIAKNKRKILDNIFIEILNKLSIVIVCLSMLTSCEKTNKEKKGDCEDSAFPKMVKDACLDNDKEEELYWDFYIPKFRTVKDDYLYDGKLYTGFTYTLQPPYTDNPLSFNGYVMINEYENGIKMRYSYDFLKSPTGYDKIFHINRGYWGGGPREDVEPDCETLEFDYYSNWNLKSIIYTSNTYNSSYGPCFRVIFDSINNNRFAVIDSSFDGYMVDSGDLYYDSLSKTINNKKTNSFPSGIIDRVGLIKSEKTKL